jgi:N-hydroxyarylamine O-acetyltransferase
MKSSDEIDFDSYFSRIGYLGSAATTLNTLHELQLLHTRAIAFENLDPLMGKPVSLNVADISNKFLNQGRGGYCFEHNIFFQRVLQSLGFSVSALAALPQWNRSEHSPRIHMVLLVHVQEERFIVDVGFGRLTLTSPLRVGSSDVQFTNLEPFRIMPIDDQLQVQINLKENWLPVFQVSLQRISHEDCAVYNWFTSTNPDVVFTNHLMAARPGEQQRYGMFDNVFSTTYPDGSKETLTLKTRAELADVLQEYFHIRLPSGCEDVLESLVRRSASI